VSKKGGEGGNPRGGRGGKKKEKKNLRPRNWKRKREEEGTGKKKKELYIVHQEKRGEKKGKTLKGEKKENTGWKSC